MPRVVVFVVVIIFAPLTLAAEAMLEFDSPQQEARYLNLIDELRCMVCQNQNLADSNAALAQDLRNRTYDMLLKGRTDEEIVSYMVERYGDFVLYRPPFKLTTLVLWLGPVVFLVIAAVTIVLHTRRLRHQPDLGLDPEERRQARRLLKD